MASQKRRRHHQRGTKRYGHTDGVGVGEMLCVFRRYQCDDEDWRARRAPQMCDRHNVLLLLASFTVSTGFVAGMLCFIDRVERMAVQQYAMDSL